jgi:RHS repeat-associated protein
LIGTASAAPFSFSWTNVAVGTYSLTAVATNDAGQTTTSAAVAITVKSGVAQMYYIHPDHLNTPRLIANQAGTTVWKWDNTEPFGNSMPNDDPDGDGVPFVFDLRFPGQFFDRETGLSYNVMRDYDSGIGRYVQADPVGSVLFGNMSFNNLGGVGLSPELARSLYRPLLQHNHLYTYVRLDPLGRVDPTGLDDTPGGGGGGGEGSQSLCYVIGQIPIPVGSLVNIKGWFCIYLCKTFSCPPKMWVEYRIQVGIWGGCASPLPGRNRPPIPPD